MLAPSRSSAVPISQLDYHPDVVQQVQAVAAAAANTSFAPIVDSAPSTFTLLADNTSLLQAHPHHLRSLTRQFLSFATLYCLPLRPFSAVFETQPQYTSQRPLSSLLCIFQYPQKGIEMRYLQHNDSQSDLGPLRQQLIADMAAHDHAFAENGGFGELQRIRARMQRQLPSYAKCPTDELKMFVRRRNLAFSTLSTDLRDGSEPIDRAKLIAVLESADDTPGLADFMNFPPEIREKICKYYVYDLPSVFHKPGTPPLARVSRSLRATTLPLFYRNKTFALEYRARPSSLTGHVTYTILPGYHRWLSCLPSVDLECIRSWQTHQLTPFSTTIDIQLEDHEHGEGRVSWGARVTDDISEEYAEGMLESMRAWLRGVKGVDGKRKLQKCDVDGIGVALEGCMQA